MVLKSTLDVLNNEADLSEWNETLLVFIPKSSQPRSTKEFRPISLCNTIYKIVSKVLVNRLRGALGEIVDQNQSVFLSGRQITDNIIVGFECMHWIKNRKNKKSGFAALKLDMSKAYDRIEWSYVEALLNKLNFPESMTRIIIRCISTVRYSMVINGRLYGNITPSRGLRQGDPLSPLLLVLCAQGLSSMLHKLQRQGNIQGVQFGKKGPSISHLLFAYDSLLFFKADIMSSLSIKNCLRAYEEASGQVINFEKSAITFSSTTPNDMKAGIQEIFNIKVTEGHAIYLGLPTASMRNKRMQFGFLRERVLRKLELWKNKHLSAGGKEVLLKTVVQAIPNYTMACFKVPDTICKDIDRACARFWWGGDDTRRKLHWCKWKTLCVPKEKGGLGFRRLIDMNKAMLAKQVWRFLTKPELLAARVLKAKYFQHSSILDTKVKSNVSYIWRSICGSRSFISRGLRWKIGKNSKLKVGNAAFVPNLASGIPTPFCPVPDNLCISDLVDSTGDWDRNKLEAFFRTDMVKEICQVRICDTVGDRGYWNNNDNGMYTVKSGYLTSIGLYEPPPNQSSFDCKEWAKLVWNLKIPPKLKVFYWKVLHNFLPVPDNLISHHIPMKRICEVCGQSWGTTIHSLFLCTRVKHVWKGSKFWEVMNQHRNSDIIDLGRAIRASVTKEDYELWITTMWVNWTFLCQLKHRADSGTISVGLEVGRSFYEAYREACIASRPRSFFGIPIGEKIWKPPVEGIYRIDVDACYDSKKSLFGIGVVIRNSSGGLCAALAKVITDPGSILEGELIALLYGVGLCLQEVLGPVIMFSDSLLAVRNVKKLETKGTESLECFNEFEDLLHQGVILDVCHMYREANSVAHALARFGALSSRLSCWTTEFPTWLHDVASIDF